MTGDIINLTERRKLINQAAFQEILNAAKDLQGCFIDSDRQLVDLARRIVWYAIVGSKAQEPGIARAGVLKNLAKIRESLTKDKLSDSEAVQQALAVIEKKLAAVV